MTVYATYLRANGLIPCLFALLLCLLSRGVDIASSVWLVRWSDRMSTYQISTYQHCNTSKQLCNVTDNRTLTQDAYPAFNSNTSQMYPGDDDTRSYYISGYAVLGLLGSTYVFCCRCLGLVYGTQTEQCLHYGPISGCNSLILIEYRP